MSAGLSLEYRPTGRNGTVQLTAVLDGETLHTDKLDVSRAASRERFAQATVAKCPGIDRAVLDGELLRIASETTAADAEPPGYLPEVDVSAIVRPELFHTADVSGVLVPTVTLTSGGPAGRWALYLRWADGRRERRDLSSCIDLPDGGRLWMKLEPADPDSAVQPAWTLAERNAWLDGAPAPEPGDVFRRLCERLAFYLDFPPDSAAGDTATLSLWVLLTYAYPAWSATPYLSIGGPMGSGKSRVFELLARLVFRPLVAANMTAPTLFRTLHESGGILLLDEAERLREGTPDAAELRSILLSGYKAGSPARRLEPRADGKYRTLTFDVYGPKAVACIAALPEALASRCIRLVMFRCGPDSPKPRRRIDAEPQAWAALRDDLHAMVLEHGPAWLELAGRVDVCPAMSGRDFELWQPLLALAAWLEEHGAGGLLGLMQVHAARSIELTRDDSTPDTDELLLRLLAEAVLAGSHSSLTPAELLRRSVDRESVLFNKWSTRGVSAVLKRYGVTAVKSHGQRVYRDVSLAQLARIQTAYGVDLGLPSATSALCATQVP